MSALPDGIFFRAGRMRADRRTNGHSVARLISVATFIAVWWLAARFAGNPQLLPGPAIVTRFAWQEILNGEMPRNVGITLLRVGAAFVLSMGIGLVAGYIAGRLPRADAFLDPWLVITLNLPVLVVIILVYTGSV